MAEEQDPLTAMAELVDRLSPEQAFQVSKSFIDKAGPMIASEVAKLLPFAIEQELKKSGYNEEVAGLLHLLAARSNDSKDRVLLKALTLYGLALDAMEKGNRLAILSPDDVIVHEVIGFEVDELMTEKAAG